MTSEASRFSPFADRVSAALAAGGVFFVAWGLVHTWFWAHGQIVDWPTYLHYGRSMRAGLVPYRDFAVEYPPGSLPVFVLPTWLHGDYATSFAWLMALCGVLLVAVVASVRPAAAFYVALGPLLVGSLILSRFDLWPALLATSSLALLLRGRHLSGWALLGAAVAAKLWPLVLVPLALTWSIRRGRPLAPLAGTAVLLAATLPFAVLSPSGLWHSITGQASRPLQVESLGAAVLTTFSHPEIVTSHGSQNIVGHHALASAFSVLQLLVLTALWVAFARGPATGDRLLRYAAACTCAFIVFGKVLSPQYLIWLLPLVPLVRGRRGLAATALLTLALLLTQVWFPQRYFDYALEFRNAGLVLARDLVLVALLAVLAWPLRLARTG
jgi:uncharacterized membrane protein